MSTPRDRLHEVVQKRMARNKRWAAAHIQRSTTPLPVYQDGKSLKTDDGALVMRAPWQDVPWKQRSIADVAALQIAGMHEAAMRADKMAQSQGTFQVVVIPERMHDALAWEAKAKALDAQGRKLIDTTASDSLRNISSSDDQLPKGRPR